MSKHFLDMFVRHEEEPSSNFEHDDQAKPGEVTEGMHEVFSVHIVNEYDQGNGGSELTRVNESSSGAHYGNQTSVYIFSGNGIDKFALDPGR